jgi:guanosine-3',5'-bis(diphosphate) 3'-pyrophosphohydrolase
VGEGNTTAQAVLRRILELFGDEAAADEAAETVTITSERERRKQSPRGDAGVIVKGLSDVLIKLARCCTPVPGDEIVGFVTRGAGVSVHRGDCTNLKSLESQGRMVEVEWAPTAQSMFLVAIQVEGLDRARLLSDITRVLSDVHVNILSASVATTRDRIAKSRFTFEMADPAHLGHVLKAVRNVDGVFDAYRVTQ